MSSVSNVTFPDGIKHKHAERGKPRVVPPVRFVPTEVPDSTNPHSTTIDITEDQKENTFSTVIMTWKDFYASNVHLTGL